ncbi:MAG: DUF853 family protein [Deltaproteobacteria bacterium]|jgi:hypothetical protein|nr:DUF853 family protein [Deltaproteobacteria bacterium]
MNMDQDFSDRALKALEYWDFNTVQATGSVWEPLLWDVPQINSPIREAISAQVKMVAGLAANKAEGGMNSRNLLGLPIVGSAGVGKTHILSHLFRQTFELGGYFVSVNVENMVDFWDTLSVFIIKALEQKGFDGRFQRVILADRIIKAAGLIEPQPLEELLARDDYEAASKLSEAVNNGLFRNEFYRQQPPFIGDLIRAVLFLNLDDITMVNNGKRWIQGGLTELDQEFKDFGFKYVPGKKSEIIKALNWLMSLGGGFTVTGFDQLDNILSPHILNFINTAGYQPTKALEIEAEEARTILVKLSIGLEVWINSSVSTLTVIALLADGWDKLSRFGTATSTARFQSRLILEPVNSAEEARLIVAKRLESFFSTNNLTPPYPSWPFLPVSFEGHSGLTPREVLKRVESYLEICREKGRIDECSFLGDVSVLSSGDSGPVAKGQPPEKPSDQAVKIELRFNELIKLAQESDQTEVAEVDLGWTLKALSESLVLGEVLPGSAELVIDSLPTGKKRVHDYVMLRYVSQPDQAPERYLSLGIIDIPNARSFQAQLREAIVQSGISSNNSSKKIGLIRFEPLSKGKITQELLEEFQEKGGQWLRPDQNDLVLMRSLAIIEKEFSKSALKEWTKIRRPAWEVAFARPFFLWLLNYSEPVAGRQIVLPGEQIKQSIAETEAGVTPTTRPENNQPTMVIGRYLKVPGDNLVRISPDTLLRHVAVFGSSGSGKTVLIKRLVEEAALAGVSSVVIDLSGDLTYLGRQRLQEPDGWLDGDEERAAKYFDTTETIIWTPGCEKGNALHLPPIPDFSVPTDDPDFSQYRITTASEAVKHILKKKSSDTLFDGLLTRAFKYMEANQLQGLVALSDILMDWPDEESDWLCEQAKKVGKDLKGALMANENLKKDKFTEISSLFCSKNAKTRISVVYTKELNSQEAQNIFVRNLMTEIFTWISRNPGRDGRLTGLVVIDEAKDFAPSKSGSPAKESIIRYANQARKYGYGLIFASQLFKSVDNNIVGNCDSLFMGKQNSPASIVAAENVLGAKGLKDLTQSNYLVKSSFTDKGRSLTMKTALCLSLHPSSNPLPDEVINMAAASRKLIES